MGGGPLAPCADQPGFCEALFNKHGFPRSLLEGMLSWPTLLRLSPTHLGRRYVVARVLREKKFTLDRPGMRAKPNPSLKLTPDF